MMLRRTLCRALALAIIGVAMATALILVAPTGGHAHGGPLEFSTDGTSWSSRAPDALFESGVLLVPGDSATATLHVRSAAGTTGVLEVRLVEVWSAGPDSAEHFGVSAVVDAGTGVDVSGAALARTSVAELATRTGACRQVTLAPGQSIEMALVIDLEPDPGGTGGRNGSVNLRLAVTFQDAGAVGGDAGGTTPIPVTIPLSPLGDDEQPSSGPGTGRETGGSTQIPTDAPLSADDTGPAPGLPGLLARTGMDLRGMILATLVTIVGGSLLSAARRRKKQL